MIVTEEDVNKLAPDDASITAGRQLAMRNQWENVNRHERALWGECKGSGKNPYFTQIDLVNIAFKCTCPSRKFPCKHSLGLLYLFVKDKSCFLTHPDIHTRVLEWIESRNEKVEAKKASQNVDKKAQEKRFLQRDKKVREGIVELKRWMKDLIRLGIQSVPQNQYVFCKNMKAKMIDAQAPGLARVLSELTEINMYEPNWEHVFLRKFSFLYILVSAYENSDNINVSWQEEIKIRLGYNFNRSDFDSTSLQRDILFTLSQTKEIIDVNLVSEKTWFYSCVNQSFYYLLQYYPVTQSVQEQFHVPGNTVDAQFFIYPGRNQQRIVIEMYESVSHKKIFDFPQKSFYNHWIDIAEKKALNIFTEEFPVLLKSYKLLTKTNEWFITDESGDSLKVNIEKIKLLKILALTLQNPVDWFGVVHNAMFKPLAFIFNNKYYTV
ncbi:MAG: SWIM zinc finger family protein [Ignavibacteria bacterium]|nr:SWIM zinc finger family protein [Ignavibacteria bacterium]